MLDNIHGRLDPKGFRSYAQKREKQLYIEEIRHGSWELVLAEAVISILSPSTIVILWTVLMLPRFIKEVSSMLLDIKKGKLIDEQSSLLRDEREILSGVKEMISSMQGYESLNETQKAAVARTIVDCLEKTPHLNRVSDFIDKNFVDVQLSLTKSSSDTGED